VEDRPIYVRSGEIEVEIHPTHPRYHELRLELIREAHPDILDDDSCEHLTPKKAEDNLRKRFISPEGGESEEEL